MMYEYSNSNRNFPWKFPSKKWIFCEMEDSKSESSLMDTFSYNANDYLFEVSPNPKTNFDNFLRSKWDTKMKDGKAFWYQLNITLQRTISNKFILQFNRERASVKRPPTAMYSTIQPFDPDKFNFNKIKDDEKLFVFSNNEDSPSIVIVNVSPLEYCHVLLIPTPEECLPQVLTESGLRTAIDFSLVSGNKYFRVGFNGLGGHASVNHLHFHGYLLERDTFLETAIVEELAYPCYQILNYPAKGFVFQIRNREEVAFIVENIFELIKLFQSKDIVHNLFISRGLDFESAAGTIDKSVRNCLRIYVWARTPSWGAKELTAFNIATCELFGHMVIKNETDYHTLTEDSINAALNEATDELHRSVVSDVRKLYH